MKGIYSFPFTYTPPPRSLVCAQLSAQLKEGSPLLFLLMLSAHAHGAMRPWAELTETGARRKLQVFLSDIWSVI